MSLMFKCMNIIVIKTLMKDEKIKILALDEEILSKTEKSLQKANFNGLSSFFTSITVPATLAVRQRSISLYLKEKLSGNTLPEVVEVRDVVKQILGELLPNKLNLKFEKKCSFMVEFKFEHKESFFDDFDWMQKIEKSEFRVKKSRKRRDEIVYHGLSNEKILNAAKKLDYEDFVNAKQCPPTKVSTPCEVSIDFAHEQIYIAGRYNKLKRHISNSPWLINGKLKVPDSVESLMSSELQELFKCERFKFSSAGREDSDVLMLGNGRPFYFELIKPRNLVVTPFELKEIEDKLNQKNEGKIFLRDLQISSKEGVVTLKESASTKCKSYSVLIKLSSRPSEDMLEKLNSLTDVVISQKNPSRVPRRADIVRDKIIHSLQINESKEEMNHPETLNFVNSNGKILDSEMICRLDLKTSAGTYVKEFVHGDEGRTSPNLSDLLQIDKAEVIALDVTKVFLDWPESKGKGPEFGRDVEFKS
ncbi:putative tRNA pseudouridine synthase Pus10 [Clydaea vesicula]|uniref:tRNA pseudouridine(55) synthase n=1 Tax=Clydaea vesicula TaxID=447962 RepID=A0AAD5U9W2_9FUNG|nr:putative tRNA pseudouridine synthase Pus10 [Clydaea vesicula]